MTYKQSFVAAIKCGGRILRETDGDYVTLPFGSEYSILLKNLESRKAQVLITIDGRDVFNGDSLILNPNETAELERFFGDDMDHGYRFKFIQKTKEIVKHRGDKVDDGLVRIEFQFEKHPTEVIRKKVIHDHEHHWHDHHHHHDDYHPPYRPWIYWTTCNDSTANVKHLTSSLTNKCADEGVDMGACFMSSVESEQASLSKEAKPNVDEGITVEGSNSQQQFRYASVGQLEKTKHVIVFRLNGTLDEEPVTAPITVRTKLKCNYCGTKSKSSARFCPACGSRLISR